MTFGEFRDLLVKPHAQQRGVSFVDLSDTLTLNRVLRLSIDDFARWTYSIFDIGRDFTLIAGVDEYSILPIFEPKTLFIDGRKVTDVPPKPIVLFHRLNPSPSSGRPTDWYRFPQERIKLFPNPDMGYSMKISGFRIHTPIMNDDVELEFPERVMMLLSAWCSLYLSKPVLTSANAFQQILLRDRAIADELRRYRSENISHGISFKRDFRGEFSF